MDCDINLARVWLGPFMTNHMTQENDTPGNKITFSWVQLQIYFLEFEKDSIQMSQMLCPILVVHIEIVHKYLQEFVSKLLEYCGHGSSEGVGRVLETKWHDSPII
jgi:hypothetical protein